MSPFGHGVRWAFWALFFDGILLAIVGIFSVVGGVKIGVETLPVLGACAFIALLACGLVTVIALYTVFIRR